jgi:hypothetical protein
VAALGLAVSAPALVQATERTLERSPSIALLDPAVSVVQQLSRDGDMIMTDYSALAFVARRFQVPYIADLSRVRVASGLLTSDRLIQEVAARRPTTAVMWNEYVPERFPEFMDWLTHEYVPAWGFEPDRYVLVPSPGLNSDHPLLQEYEPVQDAVVEPGLTLVRIHHRRDPRPGEYVEFRMIWDVRSTPSADYRLTLVARSRDGRIAGEQEQTLGAGWRPSGSWPAPSNPATYLRMHIDDRARINPYAIVAILEPIGKPDAPTRELTVSRISLRRR